MVLPRGRDRLMVEVQCGEAEGDGHRPDTMAGGAESISPVSHSVWPWVTRHHSLWSTALALQCECKNSQIRKRSVPSTPQAMTQPLFGWWHP